MTAVAFVATCRCGRQREPQAVDPENGWSLMAVALDVAAEGWTHDPVKGFRLCPDCGDAAGIPYNLGAERAGVPAVWGGRSMKPEPWKAGDLRADLMDALALQGWIAVAEIALSDQLTHRGDVVAMLVSGRRNRVDIYELKVARSDLLGDLRREKWRAYLEHGRVWFAFPAGLADVREIPREAGVIVRRSDGWRRLRAPQAFDRDPSVALMRRLVMAVRNQRPAEPQPRKADLWAAARKARTDHARRVLNVAADVEMWERILEKAKAEYFEIDKKRIEARAELTRSNYAIDRSQRLEAVA